MNRETVEERQERLAGLVSHRPGCPSAEDGARVELTFRGLSPKHGRNVEVVRCCDCGGGSVRDAVSGDELGTHDSGAKEVGGRRVEV